ncbi:MAG: chromosome segregation protein SMC, partial [Zetaproteobacteria bacterium]
MRLKTIELSGFKSFVDPTRIELGPGITSIVGPNGCGKSNIVDALRWVLGEHSARHLRGGVMDDLIFQGSETRPPVAVCDVELTFAVEKGQLPPPYHELEEIRVRRRLTRDGGSDAFINGKMVRIKDVVDLFLDTGVSTRAYAIVEQGAIARMVTARPDERRQIFEEAAGVMKYRARRRESERKMRDTRQNLDRVRDLLDEVRKQCRSLKQQAARAERFRAMQEELERARTQVLARRWRQASQQVADTHRECAALEAEERECARAQSACEQRVQRVRDALLRHEERAQQAHERVRAVERKRAELQRESERRAARRQLLAERLKATRVRLQEGKARMRRLDEELAELAAQRKSLSDQQLKQQLRQAEVEVAQAQQAHAQAEQRYRECFAAYERLRHRHETAGKERRRLEARVRQREQRCAQLEAKLARLNEEAQALAQSLTDVEAEHGKRSEALATVRQAMEAQGQRLRASEESYRQCASELEDCERRLRKLRGDEQELRARLENQAVSQPLRARLRACGGVWLDESLDVPEGMEAAVAAVLRGRDADVHLPLTVIEDNALWRELASQPLAIHVPVECQPVDHSLAQAMGMDRAHPMFSLFDGIALVEHIRDAIGRPFPCVSVDGWRYEPPGWLMPPADRRMARRFALRRRLRACMRALDEATHAVGQARMRSAEAKTRHQQAQREWEHRRLALIDAEQGLKRAAGEEERLRQQHRALRQRQAMLEEDLRIEREEWTRCREQCAEITQLDASELARAEAELAEQQQRAQALLARVDEWRQRQAAAQQALALFRQQDDNLRAQIRRTQAQQARLQTQCTQDEALLREHERALAQLQEDHSLDQLL